LILCLASTHIISHGLRGTGWVTGLEEVIWQHKQSSSGPAGENVSPGTFVLIPSEAAPAE
jgi:hypothetical protein